MKRYRRNRPTRNRGILAAIGVSLALVCSACGSTTSDSSPQTTNSTQSTDEPSPTTREVNIGEEPVELSVRGGVVSDALYYDGGGTKASVLVHQSESTMDSWDSFAEALQGQGVSSVSVSSATPDEILAAIDFLTTKDATEISLIGASQGGGAVMQALSRGDIVGVTKVVLLSPSNGAALESSNLDKVMFVAKDDGFAQRTYDGFERASEPKTLLEYDGTDHGQALLEGEHSESVLADITEFLELGET